MRKNTPIAVSPAEDTEQQRRNKMLVSAELAAEITRRKNDAKNQAIQSLAGSARISPKKSDSFASVGNYVQYLGQSLPQNENGNAVSEAMQSEIDRLRSQVSGQERAGDVLSLLTGAAKVLSDAYAADADNYLVGQQQNDYAKTLGERFSEGRAIVDDMRQSSKHKREDAYQQQARQLSNARNEVLAAEENARNEAAAYKGYEYAAENDDFAAYAQRGIAAGADNNPAKYAADHEEELTKNNDLAGELGVLFGKHQRYLHMTDEELQIYSYYLAKEGREKADEYIKAIDHRLDQRRAEHQYATQAEWAQEHPWAASGLSVVTNLGQVGSFLNTAGTAASNLFSDIDRPVNQYSPLTSATRTTNALREGTARNFTGDGTVGTWLQKHGMTQDQVVGLENFLYSTGMSMADCAASLAVFGPKFSSAAMSANASGATAYEAAENGLSAEEGLALAGIAGAAEYFTERMDIDRLLSLADDGGKLLSRQTIANIITGSGAEATEELITSYANTIADIAIAGDKSQYEQYITQLMEQGMSREAAKREADYQFFFLQPMQDAAAGALSGGVMNTSGAVWGDVRTRIYGRQFSAEDAVTNAQATGSPSIMAAADALNQKMMSGGRVSSYDIGRVQMEADYYNSLPDAQKLVYDLRQSIEDGTATLAEHALFKVSMGEKLTDSELRAIYSDPNAQAQIDRALGTHILSDDYTRMAVELNTTAKRNSQQGEDFQRIEAQHQQEIAQLEQQGMMEQAQQSLNNEAAVDQYFEQHTQPSSRKGIEIELDYAQQMMHKYGNMPNGGTKQTRQLYDEWSREAKRLQRELAKYPAPAEKPIINDAASQIMAPIESSVPDLAESFRESHTAKRSVTVGSGADFSSLDISNIRKSQLTAAQNVLGRLGVTADIDVKGDILTQAGKTIWGQIKNDTAVENALADYFGGQWSDFTDIQKTNHAAKLIGDAIRKDTAGQKLNSTERAVLRAAERGAVKFSRRANNSSVDSNLVDVYNENSTSKGVNERGRRPEDHTRRRETREEFNRRANRSGTRRVEELGSGTCGSWVAPSVVLEKKGRRAEEELTRLGLSHIIYDGSQELWLHKGNTSVVVQGDSCVINRKVIALGISENSNDMERIGHEALHMWFSTESGKQYSKIIFGKLLRSDAFRELYRHIERTEFNMEYDGRNDNHRQIMAEEIVAYISGDIHAGNSIDGLFENPDEIIEAWQSLVSAHADGGVRFSLRKSDAAKRNIRFASSTGTRTRSITADEALAVLAFGGYTVSQMRSFASQLGVTLNAKGKTDITREVAAAISDAKQKNRRLSLELTETAEQIAKDWDGYLKEHSRQREQKKKAEQAAQRKAEAERKHTEREAAKAEKLTKADNNRFNSEVHAAAKKSIASTARIGSVTVEYIDTERFIKALPEDRRTEMRRLIDDTVNFAKAFGHKVTFITDSVSTEEHEVDGFYRNGSIFVNVETLRKMKIRTVAHEITHDMAADDTTLITGFYNLYREYCEKHGRMNEFNERLNKIYNLYNDGVYDYRQLALVEEMLCDVLADLADGDSRFFDYCINRKPTLVQRLAEFFNRIINKLIHRNEPEAAIYAAEMRGYLLQAAARYKAGKGINNKLSGAIKADAETAQRTIAKAEGKYEMRADVRAQPQQWSGDISGNAAMHNLRNVAPRERTDFGFRDVIVKGKKQTVLIVDPQKYLKAGSDHMATVEAARSLAANFGIPIGFTVGQSTEMVKTDGRKREVLSDYNSIRTDTGTLLINLDSDVPYTHILTAAWSSWLRRADPATAAEIDRLARRIAALTGRNITAENAAQAAFNGRKAERTAGAIRMSSDETLAWLMTDPGAARAFAHDNPNVVRRLSEKMGDVILKAFGKGEMRTSSLTAQLQARLLHTFSRTADAAETVMLTESSSQIETRRGKKRKPLPDDMRLMYAGQQAQTADRSMLAQAQQMIADGVDAETVRQKTGWFKSMDGKWRFEIDDSKAAFDRNGFGNIPAERLKQIELTARNLAPEGLTEPLTPEEKKMWRSFWENGVASRVKLEEVFDHPELFRAYPELKGINIYFEYMGKRKHGSYEPDRRLIRLNIEKSESELKDTLIHELQHAVQYIESFASGANPEYWDEMKDQGFDSRTAEDRRKAAQLHKEIEQIRSEKPEFYADMIELEKLSPTVPRGEVDWNTLEQIEEDPPEWKRYDAAREKLEQKYGELAVWDFIDLQYRISEAEKNGGRDAMQLYYDTAGEIEARDAELRRDYSTDQRRDTPPDLGDENTVFAEDGSQSMSIRMTDDGTRYVEIDTDQERFDGLTAVEAKREARKVILEKFRGKVIGEGENSAYVNNRSAEEFAHPANWRIPDDAIITKMRTSTELDNLMSVSKLIGRYPDDGRHPDAVNGWQRYRVMFKVNEATYTGEISVKCTQRGRVFYDMTKIEDITGHQLVYAEKNGTPSSSGNVSDNTIPHHDDPVKFSRTLRNPTQDENRAWLDDYAEQYGTIPEGENVNSRGDQNVPRQTADDTRTRQTVRTYLEALSTPDDVAGELERDIVNGTFAYTPVSNKKANSYADSVLARGLDEAIAEWNGITRGGKPATKEAIALGERLIIEAANSGNTKLATKMIAEVAAEATRAGQIVQAISMVKRLSPTGQLLSIQRQVDKLNDERQGRGKEIAISEDKLKEFTDIAGQLEDAQRRIAELAEMLKNGQEHTDTGYTEDELTDTREQEQQLKDKLGKAKNGIITDVAGQVQPTWKDKMNAWRYLAMLGNPRTHIRNVIGNMVFIPAVKLKQAMASGLEHAFIKPGERSQQITASRSLREFAAQDAAEQLEWLKSGGKYNATDEITEQVKSFSEKNIFGRTLNKLADFNSNAMDLEDAVFLKYHYQTALAGWAAANNVSAHQLRADEALLQKARAFAAREAQRATYRDMNAFSDFMSQASQKLKSKQGIGGSLAYAAFEGIVPFKKTPCNIVKRSIEYSPIGVMTALSKGGRKLWDSHNKVDNDYTASEFINDLSAGMTGTMLVGLGALLSSLGMLRGRDKDKKDEFEKLQGAQEYSLIIGDGSYTIDWMSPVALPLFVGAELYEQTTTTNEEFNLKNLLDSLTMIAEPIFNLSMLDGVQSTLQSYSSEGAIVDVFTGAVESYAGQFFPTIGGQVARSVDPLTRNAYFNDRESGIPDFLAQIGRSAMSKMPGAYSQLPERIDAWGRNSGEGQSTFERIAENFFSPGYYSHSKTTEVDRVIQEIYEKTGDSSILPTAAGKYFSYNGQNYYMSADEYVTYAKTRGQTAYSIIDNLRQNTAFTKLSPGDQAACISDAYKLATVIAKCGTDSGYTIADAYAWQREAYESGDYAESIIGRR